MLANFDKYKHFILSMLLRVPILYTKQMAVALEKMFPGLDDMKCSSILLSLQRTNYVVISDAGFVMDLRWYHSVTGDEFGDSLDKSSKSRCYLSDSFDIYDSKINSANKPVYDVYSTVRIKDFIFKTAGNAWLADLIECMWYVIHDLPYSANFSTNCSFPWNVCYSIPSEDSGNMFEIDPATMEFKPVESKGDLADKAVLIAKVSAKSEDAVVHALTVMPPVTDEVLRNSIKRVVMLENRDHSFKIPHTGISEIVALNYKNHETFYDVMEQRDGKEAWSYYDSKN